MTHEELIHEFLRRVDAEDFDGLLELLTDDCSLSMILLDRDISGKAELGDFFRSQLGRWSEHREWATNVIVEGDVAGSELHFEGVTTAGRKVDMDSLEVWDFAGGRIRRIRVYADTAPLQTAFA